MSLSGAIRLQTSNIDSILFKRIIETMLDYGWSFDDEGRISFMIGDFDWEAATIPAFDEVVGRICENIDGGLPSGITLLWGDSKIGGSFLFINPEEILFSLIIRPLFLQRPKVIDFSWYLQKLEPVFDMAYIEKVICVHE